MAHRITERCTSSGTCARVCPTGSIMLGRDHFVIDTDSCEDCGLCVLVCPVDAIVHDEKIGIEDSRSSPVTAPVPKTEPAAKAGPAEKAAPAKTKPR